MLSYANLLTFNQKRWTTCSSNAHERTSWNTAQHFSAGLVASSGKTSRYFALALIPFFPVNSQTSTCLVSNLNILKQDGKLIIITHGKANHFIWRSLSPRSCRWYTCTGHHVFGEHLPFGQRTNQDTDKKLTCQTKRFADWWSAHALIRLHH